MSSVLQEHLAKRRQGVAAGINSVCSAHPWVIRAAAEQAAADGSLLLVEATSNQVNQFGGYTGMRPAEFRKFVLGHAGAAGVGAERLILGGDHLGPNPWRSMTSAEAMDHAAVMVAEYVRAGFSKIHLDASMACADDAAPLSDEVVAQRTVQLCKAAEAACVRDEAPVYVIGTEVPVPGGATHSVHDLEATSVAAAAHTLEVHQRAFKEQGLGHVWPRVVAMVVQPGLEFDHDAVVAYDRQKASQLVQWLRAQTEEIVFEAHSTDYQLPGAYVELVEDGFAILKVGPALTFAMREALDALEDMEVQLIPEKRQSHLARVVEETMLREPADWMPYYSGDAAAQKLLRRYSYSDRIRYYWHRPEIVAAVERLIVNLSAVEIPESMLSRYLPAQYLRLREKAIGGDPVSLVVDKVRDVLRAYAAACAAR
ncbi:MAG: D-tagatose-bisphosphate aldolase, class II, non-catalytic subunit [Acidobacteria bacterium]|nr:D-tagatose-bisphosphate aldolase, class II, non-catalytic subunit [Acidobacteriota bacterium]